MSLPELTEQERLTAEVIAARTQPVGDMTPLVNDIARIFAVSTEDILGPSRDSRLVDARAVIAIALRDRGLTQIQIGEVLHRDHTRVYGLLKRFKNDFELRSLAKAVA